MALCGNTQRRKRGVETGQLIVHKLPRCTKHLPRHERGKTHGSYGRCWALQVCSFAACARLAKPRLRSTHRHGGVQIKQLATQTGVVNCCGEACAIDYIDRRRATDVQMSLGQLWTKKPNRALGDDQLACVFFFFAIMSQLSTPAWVHCTLCANMQEYVVLGTLVTNSTASSTQCNECMIIIIVLQYSNTLIISYLRYRPYQGRKCRFCIHNDHCEIMHTQ